MVSAVYDFYAEPKGFEGGELRIHRIGARDGDEQGAVDVPPDRNSCVFFPSWARHEVRPVPYPWHRFDASRFAINCWFYGQI